MPVRQPRNTGSGRQSCIRDPGQSHKLPCARDTKLDRHSAVDGTATGMNDRETNPARPPELLRALDKLIQSPQVYVTLNGPAEFHATGRLKDWDITARLPEIRLPTLVLGGRYDEVTPEVTEALHRGIAGSECALFEQSSHMPHFEERVFHDAGRRFSRPRGG